QSPAILEPTPSPDVTASLPPPDASTALPAASDTPPPALEGTFPRCSEVISGLCLTSVGTDALNGNTIFSLKVRGTNVGGLYLLVTSATTNRYECQSVETLPSMLYCAGPSIAPGTMVNIEVYDRAEDRLLATGSLLIPSEAGTGTVSQPTPSYPSYPSYP
ncbi:MAG: hypothetical protein WHV44_06860, partial [Anaerolineales bacterium]